jgi:CheY-like chemotaxis protein
MPVGVLTSSDAARDRHRIALRNLSLDRSTGICVKHAPTPTTLLLVRAGTNAATKGTLSCPNCGWSSIRRSSSEGLLDWLAALLFLSPLRCRKCRLRFYRLRLIAKRARSAAGAPASTSVTQTVAVASGKDPQRILLLDGDSAIRKLLRRLLDREGYQVREAVDINHAIAELHQKQTDLAVINFGLGEQGQETIRTFQDLCPGLKVMVLSDAESGPERPGAIVQRIKEALTGARLNRGSTERRFRPERLGAIR